MIGLSYRLGRIGHMAIAAAGICAQLYLGYMNGGKPGLASALVGVAQVYGHLKALETPTPPKV